MSIFSRIKDFFTGVRGSGTGDVVDDIIDDGFDDEPTGGIQWTIDDVYASRYLFSDAEGTAIINNFFAELEQLSAEAQSIKGHANADKATYSGVAAGLADLVMELTNLYGSGVVGGAIEKARNEDGIDLNHMWLYYLTDNDTVNEEQELVYNSFERIIQSEAHALDELRKKRDEYERQRKAEDAANRARAQEQARKAAETARKYSEGSGSGTEQRGIFGRRKK